MPKNRIAYRWSVSTKGQTTGSILDMLRYDHCRVVRCLSGYEWLLESAYQPTPGRWASFGIKIGPVERVTVLA